MVVIVKDCLDEPRWGGTCKVYIHKTFKIYYFNETNFKKEHRDSHYKAFITYEMNRGQAEVDNWWRPFEDIKKLKNYHKAVLKLIKKKWWVKGQYTYFYTKHSHGGGHRFWLEKNVEIPNYTRYIHSCITPNGVILMTNYDGYMGGAGVTLYNPLNNKIYLKTREGIKNTDLNNIIF
tara:strand:+ start:130 stop:660 length:531 start_codon:yes stop_codon:yes gene_type:complete